MDDNELLKHKIEGYRKEISEYENIISDPKSKPDQIQKSYMQIVNLKSKIEYVYELDTIETTLETNKANTISGDESSNILSKLLRYEDIRKTFPIEVDYISNIINRCKNHDEARNTIEKIAFSVEKDRRSNVAWLAYRLYWIYILKLNHRSFEEIDRISMYEWMIKTYGDSAPDQDLTIEHAFAKTESEFRPYDQDDLIDKFVIACKKRQLEEGKTIRKNIMFEIGMEICKHDMPQEQEFKSGNPIYHKLYEYASRSKFKKNRIS